jgi:hypothetical protein
MPSWSGLECIDHGECLVPPSLDLLIGCQRFRHRLIWVDLEQVSATYGQ